MLIVSPATVLHQWVAEFHKWWPPFRVAVLHSTGTHAGSKKRLVQEIVEGEEREVWEREGWWWFWYGESPFRAYSRTCSGIGWGSLLFH